MSAVDEVCNRYVDAAMALNPMLATAVGVAGHDDRLTDYSPAGYAARAELDEQTLAQLTTTAEVGGPDRVAARALREHLENALQMYRAGYATSDLNTVASPLQEFRQVFDLMDTSSEDAWAVVATRLRSLPAALLGYQRTLAESAKSGRVAARRQVLAGAKQARRYAGHTAVPSFFGTLVESSGTTGALRADLNEVAAHANTAYSAFAAFLSDELVLDAPELDAVGPERYAICSRQFTGTTLNLAETYEWGWAELDRIETEMREIAGRIVSGGSVADAIAVLDADPARQLIGPTALQRWLQETADTSIADLAGVHFDIPEPIRRIECRLAPTSGDGIYYTGPSEDFSRPGRMWWSLPDGAESFTTWREKTTVFHEGVPGHHLQIGQTAYRSDGLNRFQRLLSWMSGHGEGWALYAERLMAELGYLDDPGDRLGMLDGQALRAARVVLDIGVHLQLELPRGAGIHEGERWNAEIGLEFLRAHTNMDDDMRQDELNRYLGWPGQAASYKVGEQVWLECRAEAMARHGAEFDLKAFHAAALNLGSMGLDQLRDELALV